MSRLVLCALALTMLAASDAGIDAKETVLQAPVEPALRAVRRCPNCGWIEAKRKLVPSVADPDGRTVYEYTVRMADGSSSVFRETLPAWRLGERLMVIHGTGRAKALAVAVTR